MKAPKVSNRDARGYVQRHEPFEGSNTYGAVVNGRYNSRYVVTSYGDHWPMFIYEGGQWFENADKYSKTTSKQHVQLHPQCKTIPMGAAHMNIIAAHGIAGLAAGATMDYQEAV